MYFRQPTVAGTFYPDNPQILKEMIEDFLHQATVEKLKVQPKALIVPHAGYIYSGPVAAYAFKIIENYSYKKIILLGPSHHFPFNNLVSCAKGYWETPLGKVEVIAKDDFPNLKDKKEIIESFEIHQPEHCLEVQLPFLQTVLNDFQIFPLLVGNIINGKKTGMLGIRTSPSARTLFLPARPAGGAPFEISDILSSIYDEKTLFLVSSDLSHYLPYNQAKMVDKVTIDAILSNDIQRFDKYGDACGKSSIKILLNIAKKRHWKPKFLCAMNSGETSGEKSQVVGYASIAYYE